MCGSINHWIAVAIIYKTYNNNVCSNEGDLKFEPENDVTYYHNEHYQAECDTMFNFICEINLCIW